MDMDLVFDMGWVLVGNFLDIDVVACMVDEIVAAVGPVGMVGVVGFVDMVGEVVGIVGVGNLVADSEAVDMVVGIDVVGRVVGGIVVAGSVVVGSVVSKKVVGMGVGSFDLLGDCEVLNTSCLQVWMGLVLVVCGVEGLVVLMVFSVFDGNDLWLQLVRNVCLDHRCIHCIFLCLQHVLLVDHFFESNGSHHFGGHFARGSRYRGFCFLFLCLLVHVSFGILIECELQLVV